MLMMSNEKVTCLSLRQARAIHTLISNLFQLVRGVCLKNCGLLRVYGGIKSNQYLLVKSSHSGLHEFQAIKKRLIGALEVNLIELTLI